VALSFTLALVACRVTGETDTTPVGAMGKITQLVFGALSPGNVNVNLMSANVTAAAAGSSADLLTDLKSGYLLGAHPRKQFIAQFAGIFVGTLGERCSPPSARARRECHSARISFRAGRPSGGRWRSPSPMACRPSDRSRSGAS
jgi:hypothetical protein